MLGLGYYKGLGGCEGESRDYRGGQGGGKGGLVRVGVRAMIRIMV